MTDVNTMPFEPWPECDVHVEHGLEAVRLAAERSDVIVVVDVLSFSTSLSIAIEKGAEVLALSSAQIEELGGRDVVARTFGAHVVAKHRDDRDAKFTLAPSSLTNIEPGDRLILTSLNGARMVAAAASTSVLVGSLRSAAATAAALAVLLESQPDRRITLIAATEQWTSVGRGVDGSRIAIEDWLGAGMVAAYLADRGRTLSIEADIAANIARSSTGRLEEMLSCSVSGRELIARGFAADVSLAAELDVTSVAALRQPDGFFRPRP